MAKSQFRLENKRPLGTIRHIWDDIWSGMSDIGQLRLPPYSMSQKMNFHYYYCPTMKCDSDTLRWSSQEIGAGKQLNYSLKTLTPEDITSRIVPINPEALSSDWMKSNGATALHQLCYAAWNHDDDYIKQYKYREPHPLWVTRRWKYSRIKISYRFRTSPLCECLTRRDQQYTCHCWPSKTDIYSRRCHAHCKENNIVYRTHDVSGTMLSKESSRYTWQLLVWVQRHRALLLVVLRLVLR